MSNLEKILNHLDEPKTFSRLKKETGLENGVLQHHINNSKRIEKKNKAIMREHQCNNCELSEVCGEKCIQTILQNSKKRSITKMIGKGLSQAEIAEKMGLSRPTVSYHVKGLRENNILDRDTLKETVKKAL